MTRGLNFLALWRATLCGLIASVAMTAGHAADDERADDGRADDGRADDGRADDGRAGDGHAGDDEHAGDEITDAMLLQSVRRAGGGYSTDEILCRDSVRREIDRELTRLLGRDLTPAQQRDWAGRMIRIRKRGRWSVPATRRGDRIDEDIYPVAEMAARAVMDRYRITSDELLIDPAMAQRLDREAARQRRCIDPVAVRKAVLNLRKRRRLRPELVLKVADWDRVVTTHSCGEIIDMIKSKSLPDAPGVYLFRGENGYVYIGETVDLRKRLASHLTDSDRDRLAEYLRRHRDTTVVEIHRFADDSPGGRTTPRRAYESELIRSRRPALNLRP